MLIGILRWLLLPFLPPPTHRVLTVRWEEQEYRMVVEWEPSRAARWLGEKVRRQTFASPAGVVWRDLRTGERPEAALEALLEKECWLVRSQLTRP